MKLFIALSEIADRKYSLMTRSRKSTSWPYFAYVHELMSKIVVLDKNLSLDVPHIACVIGKDVL